MTKFIFIIGSSGTGKSTASAEVEEIAKRQGLSVATLNLDHYYLPKRMIDPTKPKNFDVPEALDQKLIREHLKELEAGRNILRPTYDMQPSDRVVNGEVKFPSQDVIIVEGIFAGEYMSYLKRETHKFKICVQSPQIADNYTRKAERDLVERKKTKEHIDAMKRNQIVCLFKYVAPHMNSSNIVIENTWQPKDDDAPDATAKVPMIVQDKLRTLVDFLKLAFEPKFQFHL